MKKIDVVILAAGKGTRMHSEKPKVLHQIAGKSMLEHVVLTTKKLNSNATIIVYGHGGEAVVNSLKSYELEFVLQEPQLGTGHAVQQAIPKLDDDSATLILYGDVPLIQADTLRRMINCVNSLNLLTTIVPDAKGYGRIVRDKLGHVIRIVEEKDATSEQRTINEINTGILCAPTKMLKEWLAKLNNKNAQEEYYLTDIIEMAVHSGITIQTIRPDHDWEVMGINSKLQLAELERIWQIYLAKSLLNQGVTICDPARIDVRGELKCGYDVEIDVGCIFSGKVFLGNGVKIGAYSVISDSLIADRSEIAPYSHIDHAEIGADCHIGPFARIRPGSTLHNEVHVGNFVEIKNSEISSNSKANHLSYIGDASVGRRVNIGAGTITCNYDGANKYRTVIEDDVFVGSDTQLVAPVTIGKGATIGAGSTITKDTPPAKLTLSRAKQISIDGWQRPTKKK